LVSDILAGDGKVAILFLKVKKPIHNACIVEQVLVKAFRNEKWTERSGQRLTDIKFKETVQQHICEQLLLARVKHVYCISMVKATLTGDNLFK